MNTRIPALASLGFFTLVAIFHLLHVNRWVELPPELLMGLRWAFVGALCVYAFAKKSLTTWILVAMAVGVEIGHDMPEFSQNLQVLSKIFLRMVKTIVAPLLFGTLVVGIAGHSDMKQLG